jgi:hypothetical protein
MRTRTPKILFWLAILVLVMACVPTLAAPLPTADANQVSQFIAQTANAARTQTAAALPSSTSTATITPTPRNTDTPSATSTATVIFILSTPTRIVPPTIAVIGGGGGGGGSSSGGTSSDNYACQITGVSPANGTVFDPRANFDAVWRVKNIGVKDWDRNSIDFYYLSGAEIHKIAGYDLSSNVQSGQSADLGVDMVAPRNAGTYTTTWTLSAGERTFCNMSLTIVVR